MSPAPTPTMIFLQWHGDAEPSESFDPPEESEVTWCRERIFEHDLKYVRADVAGRLAGALSNARVAMLACHSLLPDGALKDSFKADLEKANEELAAYNASK